MLRRSLLLMLVVAFGLGLIWTDTAWSHRHTKRSMGPASEKAANTQASSELPGHPAEEPPIKKDESASTPFDNILKTINIFSGPERVAAFLRLAHQAETHGSIELARKVYTLAARLHPDAPGTSQAKLRRLIIEFYLALGDGSDPFLSFQDFLNKLSGPATMPPEDLREPLVAGWSAVERRIMARHPGPISHLEKALTLWESHPAGTRPPEGALLLGRLLKNHGLFEEAEQLFTFAWHQGTRQVRIRALAELLRLAWVSQGLQGFLKAFNHWQQENPDELVLALQTWPLELPQTVGGRASATAALKGLETFPAGGGPPLPAPDLFITRRQSAWEALVDQPLPMALQEYLLRDLAQRFWCKGDFTKAGQLYRDALGQAADQEVSVFYWDRLGLAHARERQAQLAQDIFATLARDHGQFWRLVATTRQLDLELNRLLNEPAS